MATEVAETLLTLLQYPAEKAPDNAFTAPHHYLYPLYVILVLCAVKWDNHSYKEPVAVVGFTLLGMFSWFQFWPYYPVVGATLCGIALIGVVVSTVLTTTYSRRWQLAVLCLTVMAADDWFSHALGVWTPLDWIFNEYIYHLLA
jgi:hypothetical protein